MTRRPPSSETLSLILGAPSTSEAAQAAGVSESTARYYRREAGLTQRTGRPETPGSDRHLRRLGAIVARDAAEHGATPEEYLDAARAALLPDRDLADQMTAMGDD